MTSSAVRREADERGAVMSERPILFSGPMVRAILDGRKTQTRRVVKAPAWLAKHEVRLDHAWPDPGLGDGGYLKVPHRHPEDPSTDEIQSWPIERVRCPYGTVGDRLWVKEAFLEDPTSFAQYGTGRRIYRADDEGGAARCGLRWRSPIHCPRWASRITLEITNVRVERVQDISGEDAIAEGIQIDRCRCEPCIRAGYMCTADQSSAIAEFAMLWDSINGERAPWGSNPWVWVISFRRLEAGERAA